MIIKGKYWKNKNIEFTKRINLMYGSNGTGKTSISKSIYSDGQSLVFNEDFINRNVFNSSKEGYKDIEPEMKKNRFTPFVSENCKNIDLYLNEINDKLTTPNWQLIIAEYNEKNFNEIKKDLEMTKLFNIFLEDITSEANEKSWKELNEKISNGSGSFKTIKLEYESYILKTLPKFKDFFSKELTNEIISKEEYDDAIMQLCN